MPELTYRERPTPPVATMFARAIRLRCPLCGSGHLQRDFFHFVDKCPVCELPLTRDEPGYEVGTVWFNLAAAEALCIVALLVIVVVRWPDVPWATLEWLCPLLVIVAPLLFYPFAKMLFLAVDLTLQPVDKTTAV